MSCKPRVVITGASSISTLGSTNSKMIENLLAKKTNLIEEWTEVEGVSVKNIGFCDRNISLLGNRGQPEPTHFISKSIIFLIEEALRDAGIEDPFKEGNPLSLFLGSTVGNRPNVVRMLRNIKKYNDGTKKAGMQQLRTDLDEFFGLRFREDQLTQELEAYFASPINKYSMMSQCVSPILAIILAKNLIQAGSITRAFVGAYDFADMMIYLNMRANHLISDSPSLPFDRDNSGMSLADGAGMIVLENHNNARRRGHKRFYGEIKGEGVITIPDKKPGPTINAITRSINKAVNDAGLKKEEIDLISPNGNGNPEIDWKELTALSRYFKEFLNETPIPSYIANLGYSLAGSGMLDLIINCNCMMNNRVIGTISPHKVNKEFDYNYAYGDTVERSIENFLKIKVNVTGTAASLIVSKVN